MTNQTAQEREDAFLEEWLLQQWVAEELPRCPECSELDPLHELDACPIHEFDARLKKLTHGLYERVPCERGIVLAMADKGYWFRCLADAEAWLKGWQV